ncbi:hypothetical protein J7T55_012358 [Diaporthe amygdali]|uniref:uncharacterized protein n=1 Tax=Phomopsis amygdali TaxID=1214568 RepID=UPI0022FF17F2|nr:uncharacterized protein J7T55_012358 [Diaporthe amygdali]KAJ0123887.1 hypothetical protein J7T55_012358 [Diaporthe amygdali]
MSDSNLRFSESEIEAISPDRKYQTVQLPDGGYFGMLHAYHELHCLKHLRKYLYAEHYFPDELSAKQIEDRRLHLEHCVDTLRQGVMCRADVQPRTMRWLDTEPIPGANVTSPHNCNSWEALDDWASQRSIDRIFEPGYLKHPTFGDVYSSEGTEALTSIGLAFETEQQS